MLKWRHTYWYHHYKFPTSLKEVSKQVYNIEENLTGKLESLLKSYLKEAWTLNRHYIYRNNRTKSWDLSLSSLLLFIDYMALNSSSMTHISLASSVGAEGFALHDHIYPHICPASRSCYPLFIGQQPCFRRGICPNTCNLDLTHEDENPGPLTLWPTLFSASQVSLEGHL